MAAMAPLVGALADAAENALQIAMLMGGVSDTLVRFSSAASNVKNLALLIGMALLLAAIIARVQQRRQKRSQVPVGF
jgi:Ca2+/H+ antiporter